MPGDPSSLAELSERLPTFRCERRSEWVLLSGCSRETTSTTLDLLEATTAQVERAVRAIGLAPASTDARHLAIAFPSVEEYRSFARSEDHHDDPESIGHYEARARRSSFSAPVASRRLRSAIERVSSRVNADARERAEVDRAVDDVRSRTVRVMRHEAAHQILCERGVHPPGAASPAWLSEGLACAFESERLIGECGPDHDVPARRERLLHAIDRDALRPLSALVASLGRPAGGTETALDWYAQSWSVVAWLYRSRPAEFARYVSSIMRAGGAGASAAERVSAFERAFGPVIESEAAWRAAWRARDDDRPRATRATRPEARRAT